MLKLNNFSDKPSEMKHRLMICNQSWIKMAGGKTLFTLYVKFANVTSSNVQHGRGSEKAFDECLGISNVFPFTALVQLR